jgi:C4-dicarboxylate transporter, DctQ subunit
MLLHQLGKGLDRLVSGLWIAAGIMLVFCISSVTLDVVLRTVFRQLSFPWVVELNEYALFGITFFAATWCVRIGAHVRVDFVMGQFKRRTQALMSFFSAVLCSVSCLVFTVCAATASWASFMQGSRLFKYLRVPKYAFTIVICVCSMLLTIEFINLARLEWKRWSGQRPL